MTSSSFFHGVTSFMGDLLPILHVIRIKGPNIIWSGFFHCILMIKTDIHSFKVILCPLTSFRHHSYPTIPISSKNK